jgi:hypothetical protein
LGRISSLIASKSSRRALAASAGGSAYVLVSDANLEGERVMNGDFGALGFWLFMAAVVAASILKEGRKESAKEKEIQETIRAAVDKDGKVDPALLELLRERDAAAAKLQRDMWGLNRQRSGPLTTATIVFIMSLVLGFILFLILSPPQPPLHIIPPYCLTPNAPPSCDDFLHPKPVELAPKLVAFGALAAFWLGGLVAAWIIIRFGKKKEAPPAA